MTTSRRPTPGAVRTTPGTPTGQPPMAGRPRGRRPPGSDTRATIVDAARHEFAALGYRGASLRTIAARAEVDTHLIAHYFGSKQELFRAIAELPFEPEIVLDQLYAAGQPGLGRRLAQFVVYLSRAPASHETMTALVRAAATEKQAAALMREVITQRLLLPLVLRLDGDHPELRASLIASQIVGLTTATHIVGLDPLANAPAELLATSLAPVFDHYLDAGLDCPR